MCHGLACGIFAVNDHQSSPRCGPLYVLPWTKVGGVISTSSAGGTVQAHGGLLSHGGWLCHAASPKQGQRQTTEQTRPKADKCCPPRGSGWCELVLGGACKFASAKPSAAEPSTYHLPSQPGRPLLAETGRDVPLGGPRPQHVAECAAGRRRSTHLQTGRPGRQRSPGVPGGPWDQAAWTQARVFQLTI